MRPPGAGSSQDQGKIKKNQKKKATPQDYLERWQQYGEKWKEQLPVRHSRLCSWCFSFKVTKSNANTSYQHLLE